MGCLPLLQLLFETQTLALQFLRCDCAVQPHNTPIHDNGNTDPYSHTNTRAIRASSTAATCPGLSAAPSATLTKPTGSIKCARWAAFCRVFDDQHAP